MDHILKQALLGEFALHDNQAEGMTAEQFAAAHGVEVHVGTMLLVVTVDLCDYFWSRDTGCYDGWGRAL